MVAVRFWRPGSVGYRPQLQFPTCPGMLRLTIRSSRNRFSVSVKHCRQLLPCRFPTLHAAVRLNSGVRRCKSSFLVGSADRTCGSRVSRAHSRLPELPSYFQRGLLPARQCRGLRAWARNVSLCASGVLASVGNRPQLQFPTCPGMLPLTIRSSRNRFSVSAKLCRKLSARRFPTRHVAVRLNSGVRAHK